METRAPPAFGEWLRRQRSAAGLTQEELAERASLSARAISDLERGVKSRPQRDTIRLLAEALGLSAHERAALEAARGRSSAPGGGEPARPVGGYLGARPHHRLVARDAEVARISAALGEVAGKQGRLLLLSGKPGVGKTRLAQETMMLAGAHGFQVLVGRCDEHLATLPFYSFAEALTMGLALASPTLRAAVPSRFPYLGRLVPDVLPSPGVVEGEDLRPRLFHAVAGFLAALAAEAPVAVLLDDLHWADSASLELLLYLARGLHGERVLLLGTYRDSDLHPQHPLAGVRTNLVRERLIEEIAVRGLPLPDTSTLISARLDGAAVPAKLADWVQARTDGNPFFVEEVITALVEQGAIERSATGSARWEVGALDVPHSVRAVVSRRVARLAGPAQELLRLASVLGHEWDLDLLLETAGRDEAAALDYLDAALAAGLLEERRAGQSERYAFVHALIGQALYEEMPRHRLRRLHRRVGDALERLRGERPGSWAELARHFLLADESARATTYAIRAGDHAASLYAHADAVQHYRIALRLLEDASAEEVLTDVREKVGMELRVMGRYEEALEVLQQIVVSRQQTGDLARLGRAVAELSLVYGWSGATEEGVRRVQELLPVLEARGPSAALLALYDALTILLWVSGHYPEYLAAAEAMAELARGLGDTRRLARALMHRSSALQIHGRVAQGLRVAEEAIPLAKETDDLRNQATLFMQMGEMQLARGELQSAGAALQQAVETAERTGDPWFIIFITFFRDYLLLHRGEWAQVRRNQEQAVAQSRQLGDATVSAYLRCEQGLLSLLEGHWGDAAVLLDEAITLSTRTGNKEVLRMAARARAVLDVRMGHAEAALTRLHPLLDQQGVQEFHVTALLPVLAWAYLEVGDVAQAKQTIEQALRRAQAEHLRLFLVDALHVQALILMQQGRAAAAKTALREALKLARALPWPYAEASLLAVYGRLATELGEHEAAHVALAEALDIFRQLGAQKDTQQAEQLLTMLV